ncbi:hypothetical protein RchiOBHm_Chr5g0011461 [Rosa chinensis]|uniref:Uncharacterized protein n=1 Tax=Rosa chinensis TaxID=74649 RepID=A0A2P6Q4V6_ROSCH|nr:hypothetical protein RchiOBHm_Chr5g0011461 [Rosa chinensis]
MDIRNKLTYSEGIPFRRHSQFVTVPPASGLPARCSSASLCYHDSLSLSALLCLSLPLFHRAPPLHCSSSPLQPLSLTVEASTALSIPDGDGLTVLNSLEVSNLVAFFLNQQSRKPETVVYTLGSISGFSLTFWVSLFKLG